MKTIMLAVVAATFAASVFAEEPAASAPAAAPKSAAEAPKPPKPPVPPHLRGKDRRLQGEFARRPSMSPRKASVRDFGTLSDGRKTKIWRIVGEGGLVMEFSDYGGRLVRAYAPDRFGNLADVTLGWNTAAEYEKYGFSMGTLIGRFGNRIADGKFTLDGVEYKLPINEDKKGRHCNLHGGPEGWDTKIWDAKPFASGPVHGIEFSYLSKDGEMGFPGNVKATVRYSILPNNTWAIDYRAETDKPTVINLTHHSYWNLAGEASGNVLGQTLQIFADEYTQTTPGLIPTKNVPVKGTGFDFTTPRAIGAKADLMKADATLKPMDNWYDHNFVLRADADSKKKLRQAVFMADPVSGRTLEIWTTEPCMQMYGAQNLTAEFPAKAAGARLCPFAGVALETQHAPDSPNRPDFPSTVLRPGETFRSHTEYRFGIAK